MSQQCSFPLSCGHLTSVCVCVCGSHILLKFSDAQVAEIKDLDNKLSKKLITQERYDELVHRTSTLKTKKKKKKKKIDDIKI